MTYSRIVGTGRYLPERIMTNADLEKIVDTTDEWIRERTGIVKRHIAGDEQTTCDLAEQAAISSLDFTADLHAVTISRTGVSDKAIPFSGINLFRKFRVHC